jgi:aspartyl-tRNA(Asn)/glutamyl-tRNA(Gln) amidotransferase subunit C
VSVTRTEVEAMAALARLRLEAGEAERLAAQLSSILGHMDELMEADIAGMPPFAIAADDVAPPREDVPQTDPLQAPLHQLAPAWRDGFFTVPRLAAHRGPDESAVRDGTRDTAHGPDSGDARE